MGSCARGSHGEGALYCDSLLRDAGEASSSRIPGAGLEEKEGDGAAEREIRRSMKAGQGGVEEAAAMREARGVTRYTSLRDVPGGDGRKERMTIWLDESEVVMKSKIVERAAKGFLRTSNSYLSLLPPRPPAPSLIRSLFNTLTSLFNCLLGHKDSQSSSSLTIPSC
ncbi:hypothetical protein GOP47_0011876 [Adiantum capillus-veneris]|uniref:Uncharacterized protein n=1 Tax=Adiantum capillus-veneris TaxID=13818 RepID=A0A9D4UUV3_ADICA|nr:hypothetical protein GOP47_0011876 [Adiantum capillus-veneris]